MNAELAHLSEQPGYVLFKHIDRVNQKKLHPQSQKCSADSPVFPVADMHKCHPFPSVGAAPLAFTAAAGVFYDICSRILGNKVHNQNGRREDRQIDRFLTHCNL